MKTPHATWILSTLALTVAVWGRVTHASAERELSRLRARVGALDAERPPPSDTRANADPGSGWEAAADELELRLARLETTTRRAALPPAQPAEPVEPAVEPAADAVPEPTTTASPDARAELAALLDRLVAANFDYATMSDELERFFELARGSGLLEERIAELEAQVAARPGDTQARMQLANAYVGKLLTVGGPEQGLWGSRAETQWQAVVELDPEHWRAHFTLGQNYGYYPEVMGKGGEAVRHLEQALAIQRDQPSTDAHVQTYLVLAQLYRRDGRIDEARALLVQGLAAHPGNAALQQALAELPG